MNPWKSVESETGPSNPAYDRYANVEILEREIAVKLCPRERDRISTLRKILHIRSALIRVARIDPSPVYVSFKIDLS